MKTLILAATLAVAVSAATPPARAQDAPAGWKTQTKANGARTFTPPDLRAGEIYSVTIYDAAPLGGKSLEAYLRGFAGPVGAQAGQLAAPLSMGANNAQIASASGTYLGPNGARLTALFAAFSFDGGRTISVARILTSSDAVFARYKNSYEAILQGLAECAKAGAGDDFVRVPDAVTQKLSPGGALVPGVYAGDQYEGEKLGSANLIVQNGHESARYQSRHNKKFENPIVTSIQQNRVGGCPKIFGVHARFSCVSHTRLPLSDSFYNGGTPA